MGKIVIHIEKTEPTTPEEAKKFVGMEVIVEGSHMELMKLLLSLQIIQPKFHELLKDAAEAYENPLLRTLARKAIHSIDGRADVSTHADKPRS